jgi:membrane fusion protein, multidrug efflux system
MKTSSFTCIMLGLMLLAILNACTGKPKETYAESPVRVQTLLAEESEIIVPVRSSGRLAGRTESRLSFKTGGILNKIYVREGQNVEEGQLLAQLDLEEIDSQVKQAELMLQKAERDHSRADNLYRDSVVTLEQLQNAYTALEVSRTNSRITSFNLDHSTIRAPSKGKILKRIAEVHEIVGPGYPVFMFASTQGEWIVRTSITDQDVIRIAMLDSAQVFFDAYPGEVFMGLVSEIGTLADPYTGTYELEIQLVRKPERLVSGLMAITYIFPSSIEKKILLPMESLVEGAGLTGYVYILEDETPRRKKIRICRFLDEGLVVEEGILPGEEVVTLGAQYIDSESTIERITSGQ